MGPHPSPEPPEPTTRLPISGNGTAAHLPAAAPRKYQPAFRLDPRVTPVTKPAISASRTRAEPLAHPLSPRASACCSGRHAPPSQAPLPTRKQRDSDATRPEAPPGM